MDKRIFIAAVATAFAFSSCQPEATTDNTQARIDSMVQARVDEIRSQMMAENDRIIDSLAQVKADSMLALAKGKPTKPTRVVTAPPKAPVKSEPVVAQPVNPKEDRFSGKDKNNKLEKDARFDDAAAQKLKEENRKKKEERFK